MALMRGANLILVYASLVVLVSCGQASVRAPDDREPLRDAFAEADRLVSRWISEDGPCPLKSVRLREKNLARDLRIDRLDLHALDWDDFRPATWWVAGVSVWEGKSSDYQGALRLYRREGTHVRLVGTTDDTPLVLAAKSPNGLKDYGDLGRSLGATIERVDYVIPSPDGSGWLVSVCYRWGASCGAGGGASVRWLIREGRFYPREAEYSVSPLEIQSDGCSHQGRSVFLRRRAHFAFGGSDVKVEQVDFLDPWLEAADRLLAVSSGKVSAEQVRGMASPDDLKALARYHVWGSGDTCPCEAASGDGVESRRIRVHVGRERLDQELEIGWMTLLLGGTARQPKLESIRFVPDETQPDWESMK